MQICSKNKEKSKTVEILTQLTWKVELYVWLLAKMCVHYKMFNGKFADFLVFQFIKLFLIEWKFSQKSDIKFNLSSLLWQNFNDLWLFLLFFYDFQLILKLYFPTSLQKHKPRLTSTWSVEALFKEDTERKTYQGKSHLSVRCFIANSFEIRLFGVFSRDAIMQITACRLEKASGFESVLS